VYKVGKPAVDLTGVGLSGTGLYLTIKNSKRPSRSRKKKKSSYKAHKFGEPVGSIIGEVKKALVGIPLGIGSFLVAKAAHGKAKEFEAETKPERQAEANLVRKVGLVPLVIEAAASMLGALKSKEKADYAQQVRAQGVGVGSILESLGKSNIFPQNYVVPVEEGEEGIAPGLGLLDSAVPLTEEGADRNRRPHPSLGNELGRSVGGEIGKEVNAIMNPTPSEIGLLGGGLLGYLAMRKLAAPGKRIAAAILENETREAAKEGRRIIPAEAAKTAAAGETADAVASYLTAYLGARMGSSVGQGYQHYQQKMGRAPKRPDQPGEIYASAVDALAV
jgi:hypothetical protein